MPRCFSAARSSPSPTWRERSATRLRTRWRGPSRRRACRLPRSFGSGCPKWIPCPETLAWHVRGHEHALPPPRRLPLRPVRHARLGELCVVDDVTRSWPDVPGDHLGRRGRHGVARRPDRREGRQLHGLLLGRGGLAPISPRATSARTSSRSPSTMLIPSTTYGRTRTTSASSSPRRRSRGRLRGSIARRWSRPTSAQRSGSSATARRPAARKRWVDACRERRRSRSSTR